MWDIFKSSRLTKEQKLKQKQDKLKNQALSRHLRLDKRKQETTLRLLLLGTGDSGKTTIKNQLQILYGDGISDDEVSLSAPKIYQNICHSFSILLQARDCAKVELEDPTLINNVDMIDLYKGHIDITPTMAKAFTLIWDDKGFQELWRRRAEFPIYENLEYYMDNIDRIGVGLKNFKPTLQDHLRCKVRTIGVSTKPFILYSVKFMLYDVGGQRGERKKWLTCFNHVVTVIFVASLSEYDQNLFEEPEVNRREESIRVWRDIVNRKDFKNVGFVLLFNKMDLFKDKVLNYPYKIEEKGINSDYTGDEPSKVEASEKDAAIESCSEHTVKKYLDEVDIRTGLGIVNTHYTTALDSTNVDTVFKNSRNVILNRSLFVNGLPTIEI